MASRGMPVLDAAGNPVAGPRANVMTRMRVHSPDPTAPVGSASREGWTVNIEQGNARMTADGQWFDTRYGTLPNGARFDVRPYRRGPAGEWIEAGSGLPVGNPAHIAALEGWDRNMAASHIPLFPGGGAGAPPAPPRIPPPEPPPMPPAPGRPGERAAFGIPNTSFTGDAAARFGLMPATAMDAAAAIGRLTVPETTTGKFAGRDPAEPGLLRLRAANDDQLQVRVEMVDRLPRAADGEMPVATYDPDGDGRYVIRVSRGAPAEAVERALAHELTELHHDHGMTKARPENQLVPGRPAGDLTPKMLSPHDRGRLAEFEVLARQLAEPGLPDAKRNALLDEAQKLAAHLGLAGDGPDVAARRALADSLLPDEPTRQLAAKAVTQPPAPEVLGRLRIDDILDELATAVTDDPHDPHRKQVARAKMRRQPEEERLRRVAEILELSSDDLVRAIQRKMEAGEHGRMLDALNAIYSLRDEVKGSHLKPLYGDLEGYVLQGVLEENVAAIGKMREFFLDDVGLRNSPTAREQTAILTVMKGGVFLGEVLAHNDPILDAAIHPIGKGEKGERTTYLEPMIHEMIKQGKTKFFVADFYMGGSAANEFNNMYQRILERYPITDYPDLQFQSVWMREKRGFERLSPEGSLVIRALTGLPPDAETRILSPFVTHATVVLGDDMRAVTLLERPDLPIRIFDRTGKVVAVVRPPMPDPENPGQMLNNTRQILISLMRGANPNALPEARSLFLGLLQALATREKE